MEVPRRRRRCRRATTNKLQHNAERDKGFRAKKLYLLRLKIVGIMNSCRTCLRQDIGDRGHDLFTPVARPMTKLLADSTALQVRVGLLLLCVPVLYISCFMYYRTLYMHIYNMYICINNMPYYVVDLLATIDWNKPLSTTTSTNRLVSDSPPVGLIGTFMYTGEHKKRIY